MYEVTIRCFIKSCDFITGKYFLISSKESEFKYPETKDVEDGPINLFKKITNLDYNWINPQLSDVYYEKDEGFYIEFTAEIPLETKLFSPYIWKLESEIE